MTPFEKEDDYEKEFNETPDFAQLMKEQIAMLERSWNMMLEKGYAAGQPIPVDYVYVCPKRDKAKRLKAFLETHEGHQTKLVNNDDEFEISGMTPPMVLSYEILQAWVEKMVSLGAEYECAFDGWTTEIAAKRKAK